LMASLIFGYPEKMKEKMPDRCKDSILKWISWKPKQVGVWIYEVIMLIKSNEKYPWRWKNMKILIPLAEGFEEIEAITVIDILRRPDIEVVVAGLKDALVEGAHRVKV
jgi:hypothetical protein